MSNYILRLLWVCIIFTGTIIACQAQNAFKAKKVYKSKTLTITQIAEHSYLHTSFLQTQDFGNVPCNGLLVCYGSEALVFDTPTDSISTEELIRWAEQSLHARIKGVVPTHFHGDCLGGLAIFHAHGIASYANNETCELAALQHYSVPRHSFQDSLRLLVGGEPVQVKFFGEGHTKDNVVAYFPTDKVLFGGCLVKELGAGKGYLGDANVQVWPATIVRVKQAYPEVKVVVPGHGACGNTALLDYTRKLFAGTE